MYYFNIKKRQKYNYLNLCVLKKINLKYKYNKNIF